MFIGQMGCELCNAVLKRYIKEERPTRKTKCPEETILLICLHLLNSEILGKGYGMPSSHAQFVAFFSVYLSLFLLLRHQPHAIQTHTPLSIIERLLVSAAALGSAAAVAASRIYLNYHTPKQVLYGCGIGASLAVAWFIVTSVIRNTGILDQLLDLKIARMCRVRDLVISEDIMDAGWLRWDERRRKRHVE